MLLRVLVFPFLLFFTACTPQEEPANEQENNTEYLAATLFAEGIVSSELPEFATSFSPDGQTVYFNRITADRSIITMLFATKAGANWDGPSALPFSDGTHRDVDPFVNHDGSRLYFSSNRPEPGQESGNYDTWYVEWTGDAWSDPVNPGPPLNGPNDEVFVSVTRTGTVYFSMFEGDFRSIFRSSVLDGLYQSPQRVVFDMPDTVRVGNPLIHPDETHLFFVTSKLEGFGESDIYVATQLDDGTFGDVKNLGELVNSPYAEFAPGLSRDGRYLYFTSERPGVVGPVEEGRPPGDIYQVDLDAVMRDLQ